VERQQGSSSSGDNPQTGAHRQLWDNTKRLRVYFSFFTLSMPCERFGLVRSTTEGNVHVGPNYYLLIQSQYLIIQTKGHLNICGVDSRCVTVKRYTTAKNAMRVPQRTVRI
jgi:hypothetical protein